MQADQIAAKVDETGGDSSFGWSLTSSGFELDSNGSTVMKVDSSGLTVNGDGNFTGSVQAKNIQYGTGNTFSGNGITGGSISGAKCSSKINSQLANADKAADVFAGRVWASYGKFGVWEAQSGTFGGKAIQKMSRQVKGANDTTITIYYLGYTG